MKIKILLFLFIGLTHTIAAQEICDNGVDDDGDTLVDLNDDDCICTALAPTSLVPNPSFEDRSCCPSQNEQLFCANAWEQASAATTDYINTCGNYLGNTSIPAVAPLPLPDGTGAVGFRDGQRNAGSNYKEYVGACLTDAMETGQVYRFDFFIGFQDNVQGSTSFDMAFFGSTSCNNLPFGGSNPTVGCPVNTGLYTQLGEVTVSGNNEWVPVSFEFTADQAYEVIVLGPSCAGNPNFTEDPYFYADGLTLATSGSFGFPLESATGSVCQNGLTLSAPQAAQNSYQWYFNGVAILGEIAPDLTLNENSPEGAYNVVITDVNGCSVSQSFELTIPDYFTDIQGSICENEPYIIGDESFDMPGNYSVTLTASDGCDSLIQLTLTQNNDSFSTIRDTFCEGETYSFLDIQTDQAGVFTTSLENAVGCDSIISLELTRIDISNSLELVDEIDVVLGNSINIVPDFVSPDLSNIEWYDDNQNTLSTTIQLINYQPSSNGFIYFEASHPRGCTVLDSIKINLIPVYSVFVPTVFTPNGDGFNDNLTFFPPNAALAANRFAVFNRWGALVFEATDIRDFSNFIGWDGKIAERLAPEDVYVYILEMEFIDGNKEVFSGDFTLLR